MAINRRLSNKNDYTPAASTHTDPAEVGVGASIGVATGAVVGAVMAGPVGAVVGGVVGGFVGGNSAYSPSESMDSVFEDTYWRERYEAGPSYVPMGGRYDAYQPAYRHGWDSYGRYVGRRFDDIDEDLRRDWENNNLATRLSWEEARPAARDAWEVAERELQAAKNKGAH